MQLHEVNRINALNLIRLRGPLSKNMIAKQIQVSPTTAATILNKLIDEGYVQEEGVGHSTGGRKPVLYRFNPDKSFIIALSLANSSVRIAALNLEGHVRSEQYGQVDSLRGEAYIDFVMKTLSEFIGRFEKLDECLGISIVVPGIVQAERGIVSYNAKLDLYDVHLKQKVEAAFGLRTYIDNDMNAMMMAEKQFGTARYKEMLFISVGEGVGSGLSVNGSIYRGFSGSAGEIGHMSVLPGGPACPCGNQGCLENYVNWPAIYSRILSAWLTQGVKTAIIESAAGRPEAIKPTDFVEAACAGDPFALTVVEEMAESLAVAITNSLHLLNPQAVVLTGPHVQNNLPLFKRLNEKINSRALNPIARHTEVKPASLETNKDILGALAVLLQYEMQVGKYELFLPEAND